jgi:hypothetical protein
VLHVGDVRAVALAGEVAGLEVEVVLGDQEEREALGARATDAVDALGAGQHQVHDVFLQLRLGAGDEALHAGDVPGAVVVERGLRAAGTHVGAGVRLGQHHGGAPLALDHELGDLLVAVGAVVVDDRAEERSGAVHPDRRVRAEDQLSGRPDERRRGHGAADLSGDAEAPEAGFHPGVVALLERLRHGRGVGLGVEHRRVAVAVLEGGGEVLAADPVDLGQDLLGGVDVHLLERPGAQDVLAPEELEQVEVDVAEVALVVAHSPTVSSLITGAGASSRSWLLASNLIIRGLLAVGKHGPK